jgi:gamma-glutamyltranspeptidase
VVADLLAHVHFGLNLQEAIDAPMFHTNHLFDAIGAIARGQRVTLERSLGRLRSAGSESTVAYARDSEGGYAKR